MELLQTTENLLCEGATFFPISLQYFLYELVFYILVEAIDLVSIKHSIPVGLTFFVGRFNSL